jgi:predicted CopG family antitoxin
MSKQITISDEVYRRLMREKADRSFSEVIAAKLDSGGQLADVTGQQVLDPDTCEEVTDAIGQSSDRTLERVKDTSHTR